jgi:hypothetical protein
MGFTSYTHFIFEKINLGKFALVFNTASCNPRHVSDVKCGGAGEFPNLYNFLAYDVSHVGVVGINPFPVDEKVCLDFNEW